MEPFPDLILANRAYLDHSSPPGVDAPATGGGGLLEAVRPVIRPWDGRAGTTWIGAGRGSYDRDWVDDAAGLETLRTDSGLLPHRRLFFDDAAWRGHYRDTSNGFLWPLLHLVRLPLPDVVDYFPHPQTPTDASVSAFRGVNEAFAAAAKAESHGGPCWIHDYQLGIVPRLIRGLGFDAPLGFFLHTPFPDVDIVEACADSAGMSLFVEWLEGILGADLVGLQTEGDVGRFVAAIRRCAGVTSDGDSIFLAGGRRVRVAAYPVGIDTDSIVEISRSAQLPAFVADLQRDGLPLVVGLERADYTKGIPERLTTVAEAMRRGSQFAYAGVSSPTREGVAAYSRLDHAIEAAVAEARTVAAEHGLPFLQVQKAITWPEVVAMLSEADVLFTPSLADGMNLVPQQCAMAQSQRATEQRGVILAGLDAGVSATFSGMESDGLVPVDATEREFMTSALLAALEGRPGRISGKFVSAVRRLDARAWGRQFLADLGGHADA